jgi:Flp pilus assembly protein TadB
MHDINLLLGSLCTGLTISVLTFSCRGQFAHAFGLIENDLKKKLRRLRAPTRRLRVYLIVWLVLMVCIFLGFWLLLDNLIFAFLISDFVAFLPWYLVRRMAEKQPDGSYHISPVTM